MTEKYMELVGALVGLARASVNCELTEEFQDTVLAALCAQNLSQEEQELLLNAVHDQKNIYAPNCRYCAEPCGRTTDLDMHDLAREPEETYCLKLQILDMLRTSAGDMITGRIRISMMMFIEGLTYLGEDMPGQELKSFLDRNSQAAMKDSH